MQGSENHPEHAMAGDSAKAEVCNCKESVNDIMKNLLQMKSAVQEKTAEVIHLKEKFAEQSEMLKHARNENEENKRNMQQEINNLQHTVINFYRVVLRVFAQ